MTGKLVDTVVNGHCAEVFPDIPDGIADLVLTDPPFNCLTNWGKTYGHKENRLNPAAWFESDNLSPYEYELFMGGVCLHLNRILKENGSLFMFCDFKIYPTLSKILKKTGFLVNNLLVWDKKTIGLGQNWRYCYEFVIFATKSDDYTFNGKRDSRNIIQCMRIMPRDLEHPTQKPEYVVEELVERTTNEGDVVVDPFLGSGTTAVVAKKLNRHYIGIELNEEYAETSRKRLRNVPSKKLEDYDQDTEKTAERGDKRPQVLSVEVYNE